MGTCTGGRGHHSQFWPPEKLWDCDVKRPSCASRSGELGAGLWHCCEVFNVMHWFVKTTCPHHQHRHELSRMYKNKDFWLKTSLEEFMIISDNGGKVPCGLYLSSGAAAKAWKGCFVLSLRRRAAWRVFWMGLYAHCMCAEYLGQSSAHKRNIFLYSVHHCVCIGSFSISIFPIATRLKKTLKFQWTLKSQVWVFNYTDQLGAWFLQSCNITTLTFFCKSGILWLFNCRAVVKWGKWRSV